jgi:cytochrome b6-f complex iron-sulfur subunit
MNSPDGAQSRRRFLSWLSLGWLAFAGAAAAMSAGLVRFMFPNVLFEPPQSFRAGMPEDYAVGEVANRWKDKHGVWIVRTEHEVYALLARCTHLGCTPNWAPDEETFKCPCHGSGFDRAGMNIEGPAPRPLERCGIYQAANGEIVVDKSQRYAFEKGEWADPASFLVVDQRLG